MSTTSISRIGDKLVWSWRPDSNREAGSGIVANFLLHWFPNRVSKRGLETSYSFYLGTISFVLFMILTVSGVILMFLYVPSVERVSISRPGRTASADPKRLARYPSNGMPSDGMSGFSRNGYHLTSTAFQNEVLTNRVGALRVPVQGVQQPVGLVLFAYKGIRARL